MSRQHQNQRQPSPRPISAGDRIRVMFAVGTLDTGGTEKQLTELLVRLPRERFDPVLVVGAETDPSTSQMVALRHAKVPVISLGLADGHLLARWVVRARRYVGALRALDPDLVYAWLDETAAFLAPICRVAGIPCLVARRNLIGSSTERRNPRAARCIHWAEARATLVTANSAAVAGDCVRRGHPPARVRIVTNGHQPVPALPAAPSRPVVFGCVAQFRPEKGHHRLIDALQRLPAGEWRVDLAGDGALRPEIAARVSASGLEDQVRFIGQITDTRAFWRDRHAAILLSDSEGSPNALIEAAFAGRAALATDVGGTAEVLGSAGILVAPDDPAATAAALSQLIADPEQLARRGRASWEHVTQVFSIDAMLSGHLAALEEALGLGSGGRRRGRRGP